MGANQSTDYQVNHSNIGDQASGILVVNQAPGLESSEHSTSKSVTLPPIRTFETCQAGPKLDARLWVDFVQIISEFANSRADLTIKRQAQIQDKINRIDNHIEKFTECYMSDQHQALANLNDDCKKISEIEKMLQKCTIQGELCVSMLNKLNFLLPEEKRLEPLES